MIGCDPVCGLVFNGDGCLPRIGDPVILLPVLLPCSWLEIIGVWREFVVPEMDAASTIIPDGDVEKFDDELYSHCGRLPFNWDACVSCIRDTPGNTELDEACDNRGRGELATVAVDSVDDKHPRPEGNSEWEARRGSDTTDDGVFVLDVWKHYYLRSHLLTNFL